MHDDIAWYIELCKVTTDTSCAISTVSKGILLLSTSIPEDSPKEYSCDGQEGKPH
jgi:hypothetical protein